MSQKGSRFEREICQKLSLWWTGGSRTDCFWRTAGSGSRATNRGKRGQRTAGAYGDIAATDAEGAPLLDLVTLELKRGRSKFTIQDLMDKAPNAATQEYEKWILQAEESHKLALSRSWLVIFRRDKRQALVVVPGGLMSELMYMGSHNPPLKRPRMSVNVRIGGKLYDLFLMRLDDFLDGVVPGKVKEWVSSHPKGKPCS